MSFMDILFGKRPAAGLKTLSRPAEDRAYLVDATGIVDPHQRNGDGQASPRDHFAILKMLAQFAAREGIELQAVFTGRPLREAGEGREFKGVRVFYAENTAGTHAKIKEMISQLAVRKDIVLLTADNALEREALKQGAVCMRLATLRKGFEEHDDRERNDRDRGNRHRNDRDRQRHTNNNRTPAPSVAREHPEAVEQPAEKENPTVLDLIDPI